jgi:phospholipid/cholesterol/gamma-HCH transport system permease protein
VTSEVVLQSTLHGDELNVTATGSWTAVHAAKLEPLVDRVRRESKGHSLSVDMQGVSEIDTFGACLLERLLQDRQETHVVGRPQRGQELIDEVDRINRVAHAPIVKKRPRFAAIEAIGRAVFGGVNYMLGFVGTLGSLGDAFSRTVFRPRMFRLTPFVYQLDRVGLQAVPIILLITFLIGCIISQQSFFSFKQFGADTYIVNLLAFLVLRELGVLVVAIMVAGRSGSSYTAEIGSMKMREEIDALRTMGLNPVNVLLLPRVLALMVALPLLTFLGFLAALYGGGLVAWIYGGMSPPIFLSRLREVITVTQIEVGMYKAPFMALAIGIISCAEGLAVKGSAESLGQHTTSSVVKSIFCIILLDGLLDMFFAAIGM